MNALLWIRLELRVFFVLVIIGILFITISFCKKPFNLLKTFNEEVYDYPA